jgi:hypothetical protein
VCPLRRSWTGGGWAGVVVRCLLLFGVFAAYGSPCVPGGHSHDGHHRLAYTYVVNPDAPMGNVAHGHGHNDGGKCHVDPLQAALPSSQQVVTSPHAALVGAPSMSAWVSHSQGALSGSPPPGCCRGPCPEATVPTGTAAQAVLGVSRT